MRFDLEDVSLYYRLDKRDESLTVVDVEERAPVALAAAATPVAGEEPLQA